METLDYQTPRVATKAPYVPLTKMQLQWTLATVSVILTTASLYVIWRGANDEPYANYRRSDALVQVGLGTGLILMWLVLAAAIMILADRRKISPAWFALLVWIGICCTYLLYSPIGYLQELEKTVVPQAMQSP